MSEEIQPQPYMPLPPQDPFDKLYPTLSKPIDGTTNLETTIFITEEIGDTSSFREVLSTIDAALPGDRIILKLETPGGYMTSAIALRDAIMTTQAQVIAEVIGDVASAGTIIALSCHGLYAADHIMFMCHHFTGGTYGKGHGLKAQHKFIHPRAEGLMFEVYKSFMSKKEIKQLIKGDDFYFSKEEVDERWAGVIDYRNAKVVLEQSEKADRDDKAMLAHLVSKGYKIK